MKPILIAVVLAVALSAFFVISQSSVKPEVAAIQEAAEVVMSASAETEATRALQEDEEIPTIHITVDNFRFEGPEGISGPVGKPPNGVEHEAVHNPNVILRLKNRETVRLVFENVSDIVSHEVISPLFSAPDETRNALPPTGTWEIVITPAFRTADEGGTLTFDLSCHIRHGQTTDHFVMGMHALIEVVPQDS